MSITRGSLNGRAKIKYVVKYTRSDKILNQNNVCVCACERACVRACLPSCLRACVRACVCVCNITFDKNNENDEAQHYKLHSSIFKKIPPPP